MIDAIENIAKLWAEHVKSGLRTIEQVPAGLREKVKEILNIKTET